MTELPINPDVIIVGAGVAGLSAAERLRTSGFDVIVLEAADHTGGRCVTDNQIFSTPFDLGAAWLHCTDVNPLADRAEWSGETLFKEDPVFQKVHFRGQDLHQRVQHPNTNISICQICHQRIGTARQSGEHHERVENSRLLM